MDFLKKALISEETISKMVENNSAQCLFNLECNQEECLRIIQFMKNIGIKKIDELLINYPDVFIQSLTIFMKKLARYDILEVIKTVNEDPLLIEQYMKNLKEA